MVSDDNFAETPRPVQDEDDDEKNLKPPFFGVPARRLYTGITPGRRRALLLGHHTDGLADLGVDLRAAADRLRLAAPSACGSLLIA